MRPNHSGTGASRNRAIAGLLVCAALIAPPSLHADEAQPLRLCADPTNLLFSSDSPSQPGFYVELGQALAQALAQPIAYDWYKSYFGKRTVRVTLLGKQCDAMIGLPRSDDFMGPAVIFSSAFAREGYALVTAKDRTIADVDDLRGKRVAVQFASTPQNLLAACDDTIRLRLRDGTTRLVVNSDRLGQHLSADGYPVVVSPDPTSEGVIAALMKLRANCPVT